MREAEIQLQIEQAFDRMGVLYIRHNPARFSSFGRRKLKDDERGVPDLVLCVGGRFIGMEVKTPEGRVSEDQKRFEQRTEAAGGRYVVVTSVEEAIKAIGANYVENQTVS